MTELDEFEDLLQMSGVLDCESTAESWIKFRAERDIFIGRILQLEEAIRNHAAQKGDDRCWLDDLVLYRLVGIDTHQGLALPEEEFLGNCKRYWKCQQTGENYEKTST